MPLSLLTLLSFASGSIPFGLLIARARGIDIRKHGSGNTGATNVWRVLGPGPGLLCFALDVAKGLIPTLSGGWSLGLLAAPAIQPSHAWSWLAIMAAAILGHIFTPFAGFKGGKGVATALGAMLGLYPFLTLPALGSAAVWIAAAAIWRYVSLASILAAVALPVLVLAFARATNRDDTQMSPFYITTSALAALVIARHHANVRRLLRGTESRIGAKKPPG